MEKGNNLTNKKSTMMDFIATTVSKAGNVFHKHKTVIVKQKAGIGNWVTEADLAVERYILQEIHNKFPTHSILSEETASILSVETPKDLWICDPLDGTTNATFGIPFSCISLAYMHEGELQHGVIYDLNTKNLYYAELGRGAFVENDAWSKKAELKVRKDGLQNGLVCTGSPYSRSNFKPNWQLMDKVHAAGARLVMLGSAPLESAYVAEGKLSLYYEKGLKPWDIAAATLIVTEAGGIATSLEGNFNILHPQTFICGNKSIVNEFLQLVQGE
jgi:myo-inositol-1(or 4)-monophosphatase